MRRTTVAAVALCAALPGAATASQTTRVPAYGGITITDNGFGPRATWTYDGVLSCDWKVSGLGGIAQRVTVECLAVQSALDLYCPRMVVTRMTATVVGAKASCASTLDMGVGTSGTASAHLGDVRYAITCVAYMDVGVLVPPYVVTCADPGLPHPLDRRVPDAGVLR